MGAPGERGYIPPAVEPEIQDAVGIGRSADPGSDAAKDATGVAGDFAAGRAAALSAAFADDHGVPHHARCQSRHLHDEVQPADQRASGALAADERPASVAGRRDDAGDARDHLRAEQMLCEISGMDAFTFQPAGGSQAIFANACIIRAYHEDRGEGEQRDEIISTAFSHPIDCAAPAVAGFKVITLMPGPHGYPELDALKAAVSERTAGLMMTNPEDTGIFNPHVEEFTRIVHEAGGLCAYDQANANGILGITRARENGFDLCQFNLHKTFSVPHGSTGGSCGAGGCTEELAKYLPVADGRIRWRALLLGLRPAGQHRQDSLVPREHTGGLAVVCLDSGARERGLRQVAETAVLNNNYLQSLLQQIPGCRSVTTRRVIGCRRFAIAGSRCWRRLGFRPRMCGAGWSTSGCRAISPAIIR